MDTLYKEGVQLTHQRKYELARAKFLEAIALDGNDAEAVLSLAVVETDLGHPVAAYEALRRYLRHPKADAATAAKARSRMVGALEAKVGQIAVTASPGVEVTVDGVSAGRAPLGETVVVLPGSHAVAAAGAEAKTVDVAAGATAAVTLAAVQPAPAATVTTVTDVQAAPESPVLTFTSASTRRQSSSSRSSLEARAWLQLEWASASSWLAAARTTTLPLRAQAAIVLVQRTRLARKRCPWRPLRAMTRMSEPVW